MSENKTVEMCVIQFISNSHQSLSFLLTPVTPEWRMLRVWTLISCARSSKEKLDCHDDGLRMDATQWSWSRAETTTTTTLLEQGSNPRTGRDGDSWLWFNTQ